MQASNRSFLRKIAAVVSVAALIGLTACASTAKPEPVPSADNVKAAVTVRVVDNEYIPAEVEIYVGQAVRWVFEGPMEHDVVAEDASFVSELTKDADYTHVFETVGEFAYDCSIHPEMTGIVRVIE